MRISDWSSDVCSSDLRGAPKRGGSGDQAIAARLSDQDRGRRRIFLDLLAQAVDVGLQRVRGDAGIVAPDLAAQLLAADHGIAAAVEILEDRSLLLGQPHLLLRLAVGQQLCAGAEDRKSTRLNSSH